VACRGPYQADAYVIFGQSSISNWPSDVYSLSGKGFRITGDTGFEFPSGAGDVNGKFLLFYCIFNYCIFSFKGDGYSDFILADIYYSDPFEYVGASYLIFGKATFNNYYDIADFLNGNDGVAMYGKVFHDFLGYHNSGGFDINGDGISDFMVNVNEYDTGSGISDVGMVSIVYGHETPWPATLDIISMNAETTGFGVTGSSLEEYVGWKMTDVAGDINNDGLF
jgi:hypothetical protein